MSKKNKNKKNNAPQNLTDNLGFIKIKNFSSSKDPIRRMKRQMADLEKIFAIHIYNIGLLCRIYFKNSKKNPNPIREWAKVFS